MIRLLWCAGIALIVPVLFWLGGYDFDERGLVAVECAVFYILVMLFVAVHFPDSKGEKK